MGEHRRLVLTCANKAWHFWYYTVDGLKHACLISQQLLGDMCYTYHLVAHAMCDAALKKVVREMCKASADFAEVQVHHTWNLREK